MCFILPYSTCRKKIHTCFVSRYPTFSAVPEPDIQTGSSHPPEHSAMPPTAAPSPEAHRSEPPGPSLALPTSYRLSLRPPLSKNKPFNHSPNFHCRATVPYSKITFLYRLYGWGTGSVLCFHMFSLPKEKEGQCLKTWILRARCTALKHIWSALEPLIWPGNK